MKRILCALVLLVVVIIVGLYWKLPLASVILSIFSFLLVMYNSWLISSMKRNMFFRFKIKDYGRQLAKYSDDIVTILSSGYANGRSDIKQTILLAEIDILSYQVPKGKHIELSKEIKETLNIIKEYKDKFNQGSDVEDDARSVKTQLTVLIRQIEITQEAYMAGVN